MGNDDNDTSDTRRRRRRRRLSDMVGHQNDDCGGLWD